MSDLMLLGVLRMPVTPQSDEITLRQYIDRGRQAADLIEQQQQQIVQLEQRNNELSVMVESLYNALKHLHHNAKASGAEMGLALDVAEEALESTPHQNLNEVKREVAKAAVKTALINLGEGSLSEQDISSFAKLYANTNYPSDKE